MLASDPLGRRDISGAALLIVGPPARPLVVFFNCCPPAVPFD